MKSITGALIVLAVAAALPAMADEAAVYGTVGAEAKSVSVVDLLSRPDDYVDTMVRVEGSIAEVCPRMGCWIDIAGQDGSSTIRFKVKDGEIVFPVETKGKRVVAEGRFTRIEMTEDEAVAWAKHVAEELGNEFDPETAEVSTVIYQIAGSGATVR